MKHKLHARNHIHTHTQSELYTVTYPRLIHLPHMVNKLQYKINVEMVKLKLYNYT